MDLRQWARCWKLCIVNSSPTKSLCWPMMSLKSSLHSCIPATPHSASTAPRLLKNAWLMCVRISPVRCLLTNLTFWETPWRALHPTSEVCWAIFPRCNSCLPVSVFSFIPLQLLSSPSFCVLSFVTHLLSIFSSVQFPLYLLACCEWSCSLLLYLC